MTPRQKRHYIEGLNKVTMAPRKSWLGRFTPLSSVQSAWIKSLLTVWGECVGGKTRAQYRLENCNRLLPGGKEADWSDAQLNRITAAIEQAKKEGFKGLQAVARARTILRPVTLTMMIEEAERKDDADFIEQAALCIFSANDPVYLVGLRYYTTRKKSSDIARELQQIAPWLTTDEARKRVRWCLEIFRAKVFISARKIEAGH